MLDPKFAPQRPDLGFLRKRVRPRRPDPEPAPRIDYRHRDGRSSAAAPASTAPHAPAAPAAPPAAPPARPATPPARPATPVGSSGGLDLSRPARAATPPAPAPTPAASPAPSSSLDLSGAPASARRAPAPPAPAVPTAWQRRHVTRLPERAQRILTVQDPTVTLTRVQSAIGHLEVEAVCSPEVGDLRLGAACQLRSGGSGVVQLAGGSRFGPSARRPVLVASREQYERVELDLRQVRDVERIAVYAFSESRRELTWGGTLVVTLVGGGRAEIPLERLYPGRIAVLATLSNLDGELVLRAELETIAGDVREATRAYGFERITWRDERTPVD